MMFNVNKFTQKNLTKPMLENSFVILLIIRLNLALVKIIEKQNRCIYEIWIANFFNFFRHTWFPAR